MPSRGILHGNGIDAFVFVFNKLPPYLLFRNTAEHFLSCSDVEPFSMREVLDMGSEDDRERWKSLSLAYTHQQG